MVSLVGGTTNASFTYDNNGNQTAGLGRRTENHPAGIHQRSGQVGLLLELIQQLRDGLPGGIRLAGGALGQQQVLPNRPRGTGLVGCQAELFRRGPPVAGGRGGLAATGSLRGGWPQADTGIEGQGDSRATGEAATSAG